MSEIKLGLARLGDAPRIAAMSRTLIEAGLPWSWTPKRVAEHMKQREHLAVIATFERQLAGFVLGQFGSESVHLALLGVAETHQRQGLGRLLVRWVEESAVVAGLFLMRLEVRASNTRARRFYGALGYTEAGVAPHYYSGVEDAIQFTRDLQAKNRIADSR
ncbi:MAG TPA: GNAT family N-acetyltransferase [Steroidobacter sp.]|jgi:ribosomal-protein-alanine N-acetyltransferase|nr:GNAT family N-acetyltransferase [Steroidobacter sp.]